MTPGKRLQICPLWITFEKTLSLRCEKKHWLSLDWLSSIKIGKAINEGSVFTIYTDQYADLVNRVWLNGIDLQYVTSHACQVVLLLNILNNVLCVNVWMHLIELSTGGTKGKKATRTMPIVLLGNATICAHTFNAGRHCSGETLFGS